LIDCAIGVFIGAIVASGDNKAEILVIPDKLVELAALIVICARVAAAPRVGVNAGSPSVGKCKERA
jgi:hypothetical protein